MSLARAHHEQRRRRLIPAQSLAVAILLAASLAPVSAHAAEQTPPYQFADATRLSVSPAQLTSNDGVKVELLNNTPTAQRLAVSVTDFALKPKSGSTPVAVQLDTAQLTLPPAGSANVKLSLAKGTELAPGSHSGELVAYAPNGPVIRRAVALGPLAAKPAVKTLAFRVEWTIPEHHWVRDRYLPLEASSGTDPAALDLKPGQVLGYLSGAAGGTAWVTWSGESQLINNKKSLALKLNADGFTRPGTYSGTIDLLPKDTTLGDVTVSAAYTDAVWWPIIFLGLGVLVAAFVGKVTQVYRVVWQLQRQLGELGASHRAAQKRFAAETKDEPYGTYSITDAVDQEIKRLQGEVKKLNGPLTASLDKDEHTAVIKAIGELKQDIDTWDPPATLDAPAGFAHDLHDSQEQLKAIEALALKSGAPPGYSSDEPDPPLPKVLHEPRKRLEGETFKSLAAYRTRREAVKEDADLAETWLATAHKLDGHDQLAERLSKHGVPRTQKPRIKQAQEKLNAAWLGLWEASSKQQLKSQTEQPITEAWELLRELAVYLKDDEEPHLATQRVMAMQLAIAPTDLLFNLPKRTGAAKSQPEINYAARAEKYRDLLGRSRWALAAVAFAVAVFTGLIALYFGKTWGTATDYVTAFLWGLTTQTALTGLLAVLAPDSNPLSIPSAPVSTKPADAAAV